MDSIKELLKSSDERKFDKINTTGIEKLAEFELEKLKRFLFKENIRVQNEKKELSELQDELKQDRLQFENEKEQFKEEVKRSGQDMKDQVKRVHYEEQLLEKRLIILENGFKELDADRRQVQKDKMKLEMAKQNFEDFKRDNPFTTRENVATFFFKGVRDFLTLKKRYKDLLKIFHPDNMCGDEDTIIAINKEYEILREFFNESQMEA